VVDDGFVVRVFNILTRGLRKACGFRGGGGLEACRGRQRTDGENRKYGRHGKWQMGDGQQQIATEARISDWISDFKGRREIGFDPVGFSRIGLDGCGRAGWGGGAVWARQRRARGNRWCEMERHGFIPSFRLRLGRTARQAFPAGKRSFGRKVLSRRSTCGGR
jgi:hypothetical protein